MWRKKLAVGPKLPQASGDEHGDHHRDRIAGAVNLRVVALLSYKVGEFATPFALELIGVEVGVLGFKAGKTLGLIVVLLHRQADGVGETSPSFRLHSKTYRRSNLVKPTSPKPSSRAARRMSSVRSSPFRGVPDGFTFADTSAESTKGFIRSSWPLM